MTSYSVYPTGLGRGWRVLDQTNRVVSEHSSLALALRAHPDAVPFNGQFAEALETPRQLNRRAVELQEAAGAAGRALVRGLMAAGCSQSDCALLLGYTPARINQYLSEDQADADAA